MDFAYYWERAFSILEKPEHTLIPEEDHFFALKKVWVLAPPPSSTADIVEY
jgi:hypothetical protein